MELTEIPEGFKALLPEEAERRADILSRMERVIRLWGYEPVLPPSVEFLLPFKAVDDALERLSFKIVDRKTGKLMAIRPDFTTQIARITASSFRNEEPPLRFYYRGSVFRDIDEDREFCQFGFELLGAVETEADAEVVAVVVSSDFIQDPKSAKIAPIKTIQNSNFFIITSCIIDKCRIIPAFIYRVRC